MPANAQHKGPSAPLTVNALAQALADIRPPADAGDSYYMWEACARQVGAALPTDFAKSFVHLCQHLEPRP